MKMTLHEAIEAIKKRRDIHRGLANDFIPGEEIPGESGLIADELDEVLAVLGSVNEIKHKRGESLQISTSDRPEEVARTLDNLRDIVVNYLPDKSYVSARIFSELHRWLSDDEREVAGRDWDCIIRAIESLHRFYVMNWHYPGNRVAEKTAYQLLKLLRTKAKVPSLPEANSPEFAKISFCRALKEIDSQISRAELDGVTKYSMGLKDARKTLSFVDLDEEKESALRLVTVHGWAIDLDLDTKEWYGQCNCDSMGFMKINPIDELAREEKNA